MSMCVYCVDISCTVMMDIEYLYLQPSLNTIDFHSHTFIYDSQRLQLLHFYRYNYTDYRSNDTTYLSRLGHKIFIKAHCRTGFIGIY